MRINSIFFLILLVGCQIVPFKIRKRIKICYSSLTDYSAQIDTGSLYYVTAKLSYKKIRVERVYIFRFFKDGSVASNFRSDGFYQMEFPTVEKACSILQSYPKTNFPNDFFNDGSWGLYAISGTNLVAHIFNANCRFKANDSYEMITFNFELDTVNKALKVKNISNGIHTFISAITTKYECNLKIPYQRPWVIKRNWLICK